MSLKFFRSKKKTESYLLSLVKGLESKFSKLNSNEIRNIFFALRQKYDGKTIQQITLGDSSIAIACIKEIIKRELNIEMFDVQILSATYLTRKNIAEISTGEGKTVIAILTSLWLSICGRNIHILTANDYLAERDYNTCLKVAIHLGVSVGCVISTTSAQERFIAYGHTIVYASCSEVGFDFLKDQLVQYGHQEVINGRMEYAIVDEADSVLMDHASVPQIISGPSSGDSKELMTDALRIAQQLKVGHKDDTDADIFVDPVIKFVYLRTKALKTIQALTGINFIDPDEYSAHPRILHAIICCLSAIHLMRINEHYMVRGFKILVIETSTGRLAENRKFSDGVHQAIEAKEGVTITTQSKTYATIFMSSFFCLYKNFSGMTGTIYSSKDEVETIFNIGVQKVPRNKPHNLKDLGLRVYLTKKAKVKAIAQHIKEIHATGQPLLVGTASVDESLFYSNLLKELQIAHKVLNAMQDMKQEAEIIANAGSLYSVLIGTNRTGRGTHIDIEVDALDKGGLFVLVTTLQSSQRLDDQFKGRASRQGEKGSTIFYVSLEDEVLNQGSNSLQAFLSLWNYLDPDACITNPFVVWLIYKIRDNADNLASESRVEQAKFDTVFSEARDLFYGLRRRILHIKDSKNINLLFKFINDIVRNVEVPLDESLFFYQNLAVVTKSILPELVKCFTFDQLKTKVSSEISLYLRLLDMCTMKLPHIARLFPDVSMYVGGAGRSILHEIDLFWFGFLDRVDIMKELSYVRVFDSSDPIVTFSHSINKLVGEFMQALPFLIIGLTKELISRAAMLIPMSQERIRNEQITKSAV